MCRWTRSLKGNPPARAKGHPVAAPPAIMDSERFSGAEQRIRHRQHRRNPDPAANQQAVAGIHLKRKQIARRADGHRGADLEPMRRQRSPRDVRSLRMPGDTAAGDEGCRTVNTGGRSPPEIEIDMRPGAKWRQGRRPARSGSGPPHRCPDFAFCDAYGQCFSHLSSPP